MSMDIDVSHYRKLDKPVFEPNYFRDVLVTHEHVKQLDGYDISRYTKDHEILYNYEGDTIDIQYNSEECAFRPVDLYGFLDYARNILDDNESKYEYIVEQMKKDDSLYFCICY